MLNAYDDNQHAASSQECSDTELSGGAYRVSVGVSSGGSALHNSSGGTGSRRRSADIQRALATAAAVGAVAAAAGSGGGMRTGSMGNDTSGMASPPTEAIHRLCRTFHQLYQRQQQQHANILPGSTSDIQQWGLTDASLIGADLSNTTIGGHAQSRSTSQVPRPLGPSSAAGVFLSSVSDCTGTAPWCSAPGSDGGGECHRVGSSRARPAAGQHGMLSTLSTVPVGSDLLS